MIGRSTNDELRSMRMEAVMACFKTPSRRSPGGTEQTNGKRQSGYPVSRLRFKPGTSRTEARTVTIGTYLLAISLHIQAHII
jgi:hypothetical protein